MLSFRSTLAALSLIVASSLVWAAPAFDENPVPDRAPLPEYPSEMRSGKIEGTVIIGVQINEKGAVTDASVVKSTDARFEQAAVEIVRKKWRFKPAKKGGTPVACKVNVPIRFSLTE